MATTKSTRSTAPGKRQMPLSDVRILEVILPNGSEEKNPLDTPFPVNPGYALALQRSIHWNIEGVDRLRDPVELVSMVSTLGEVMRQFGVETAAEGPMGVAEADDVVRVAALCQQILLGFLRIAHVPDADLAARFAVLIGGAR